MIHATTLNQAIEESKVVGVADERIHSDNISLGTL